MPDQTVSKDTCSVSQTKKIKIWDVPTRLFHWFLVIFVTLSYLTGEIGGLDFTIPIIDRFVSNITLHMWSGFIILALLLFRLAWGFVGSTSARFVDFAYGPRAIIDYVKTFLRGGLKRFAGHNPAGGAMVFLMIFFLLLQACTGLFSKDESFFATSGPLANYITVETSEKITALHKQNWEIILILVLIHICANFIYWFWKKQNLIIAMITGQKDLPIDESLTEVRFAGVRTAAYVAIAAGTVVWFLVNVIGT